MKNILDDHKPIFLQIKEQIEDSIIDGNLKPGDRAPSTNEIAKFYKINPATAGKGLNELVVEDILFKRRGVGMFVTENARELLIENRKKSFYEQYVMPLKKEAQKLRMTTDELIEMMNRGDSDEN